MGGGEGSAGGGEGGGQKKLKNSADLVAVHSPGWNRPKREESTVDRMAILPMAAMPTKKHGTEARGPTPAKILYEISKSQNFWQDFGFLAFHFKDILFIFVVLSFKKQAYTTYCTFF